MTETWFLATLWLGLALIATLLSIWLRIATALSEIVVGTVAQLIIGALIGTTVLGAHEPWIKFLAGTGAIVLTFLAGAELDPEVFKRKWKEATALGIAGFVAPFLGCAAVAYYWLGWDSRASWIAGVALSTTSVAVVYAVMLETGLNQTTFGSISALFGLSHNIIDTSQYSFLIAAVVASAVVPTLIANAFFLPRHLLKGATSEKPAERRTQTAFISLGKGKPPHDR
jgi:Kef-type K+ transport system membrane component KefB